MTTGSNDRFMVDKCNVMAAPINIDILKYFRDKMRIAPTSLVPSNYTSLVEVVPLEDPESLRQLYNK